MARVGFKPRHVGDEHGVLTARPRYRYLLYLITGTMERRYSVDYAPDTLLYVIGSMKGNIAVPAERAEGIWAKLKFFGQGQENIWAKPEFFVQRYENFGQSQKF